MRPVFYTLILAASLALPAGVKAALVNASFEDPITPDGEYGGRGGGPIAGDFFPGWSSSGGNGVQNFPGTFPGSDESGTSGGNMDGPADGKNALYINGNYVFQDVGALLPNTQYTLTVAAGNQPGYGPGAAGHIALLNGTNQSGAELARANLLASGGSDPNSLPISLFKDYTASFTTGASVSGDLTILLMKDSGNQIDFDNVRLTAVAAPEPASFGLIAMAGALVLRRSRDRR